MSKERDQVLLKSLIVIAIVCFALSLYLLKDHYNTGSSICDFSETLSCSLVNSSIFSEFFNVPVALLGALWAVFLGWFSWMAMKDKKVYLALFWWNILGLLSVLYFILAEFILAAICPFCTIVHVLVVVSLVISVKLHFAIEKRPEWESIKKKMGKPLMILLVLLILSFIIFNFRTAPSEDYSEFAQCLVDEGISMYGSYTCGHCASQRELFGDAFEIIGEVECHPDGEDSQTDLCLEKGVDGTPTWIWEIDGVEIDRLVGFQELEELADWSGCALPEEV